MATTRVLSARVAVACGALAFAFAAVAPSRAHAEPTPAEAELATARALFEEGLAREDASDWAGALARFRRVAEIRATPQVVYNVALCLDRLGKIASADREYARVEGERGSAEPAVRELARLAEARRRELRARIPEVVVEAPHDPDLAVALDGAPLPDRARRSPLSLDPGEHRIVARRRGAEARATFVASPGARTVVQVPVPEEPAPERAGVPASAWVTGGVAIAAFGLAAFAALSRSSAIDELDAVCGPNRDACPEDKRPVADRVQTMTTLTNVGLGVGAAALIATGAIVYFAWKPAPKTAFVVAPSGLGASLRARF